MRNLILIDGSYYIFYRFYAIMMWWKNAHKNDPLGEPIDNKLFVEKYKHTFITKIKDLIKKLKIDNPEIIYFKDCPRENIWRSKLFPKYKQNRNYDDFKGGPFFELTYNTDLLKNAGINRVISYDTLEADDCIAITAKKLLDNPENIIYIITSDMDYLQLAHERIHIYNLKYKKLTDSKKWSGNPEQDLFCKIVMGDKSDNIPSVFKKCGPKTALKYWNNKELFFNKLNNDIDAQNQYKLNKKIIDFNEIPNELVDNFNTICCINY